MNVYFRTLRTREKSYEFALKQIKEIKDSYEKQKKLIYLNGFISGMLTSAGIFIFITIILFLTR